MVELPRALYEDILSHAAEGYPNEICGMLARDQEGRPVRLYRIANRADTPRTFYDMDPQEQFQAMMDMEQRGLELHGIYHSHPHSPAYPSHTDRELAFYSDAIYFICSLEKKERPVLRAFTIVDGDVREQGLRVVDREPGAEEAEPCC